MPDFLLLKRLVFWGRVKGRIIRWLSGTSNRGRFNSHLFVMGLGRRYLFGELFYGFSFNIVGTDEMVSELNKNEGRITAAVQVIVNSKQFLMVRGSGFEE